MLRKEQIVEQTMQMFLVEGVRSVRMDDIARRLSISKRTLYELFADKEELLYLVATHYFTQNRIITELKCKAADNALASLFMALRHIMAHSEQTRRFVDSLQKFYPEIHERVKQERMGLVREKLKKLLQRGISEGYFLKNIHVDLAVSVLSYTSSGLVSRKDFVPPEGVTQQEAYLQVVICFFRGVATAKGLKKIDFYVAQNRWSETDEVPQDDK